MYTLNLETHKKKRIPNLECMPGEREGEIIHKIRASKRPTKGANIKGARLEKVGEVISFVNNFAASARGWGRPRIPTLFGPFRS